MAASRPCWKGYLKLSLVSCPIPKHQELPAQLTDEQYRGLLLHLRILIVLAGFMVGILLAFAWEYL